MSAFPDTPQTASYRAGSIHITLESGAELRFPIADNPRLANGTEEELNRIELSPFGLHWPALDEDLSLRGILAGDHGQKGNARLGAAR